MVELVEGLESPLRCSALRLSSCMMASSMCNFIKRIAPLSWVSALAEKTLPIARGEGFTDDAATGREAGVQTISREQRNEYPVLRDFVRACAGVDVPSLLMFGDSVALRVANGDTSTQTLGEIISADIAPRRFHLVAGSGYHAGVFRQFCSLLGHFPRRPDLVVLPINLRSFSPTWDLNPLYQFVAEIELLEKFDVAAGDYCLPKVNDPDGNDEQSFLSAIDGSRMTLERFQTLAGQAPEPDSDEWECRLHDIFKWHYGVRINPHHRKLVDLKSAIETLLAQGIAVYTYITPINHEAGRRFCGARFAEVVKENTAIVQYVLRKSAEGFGDGTQPNAFAFDDFSLRYGREVFFTKHNATEHVRFEAREFLAQQIATRLIKLI